MQMLMEVHTDRCWWRYIQMLMEVHADVGGFFV